MHGVNYAEFTNALNYDKEKGKAEGGSRIFLSEQQEEVVMNNMNDTKEAAGSETQHC